MNATAIFERLKTLLKQYEDSATLTTDTDTTYYLDHKLAEGEKKAQMFAAIMVKKNYVSMYYMPVYNNPDLLADISPELKKHMQGKSCFNFTDENDPSIDELARLIADTAPATL